MAMQNASQKKMISIWFFIGCLLACYGALILAAGLWGVSQSAGPNVAMQNLHLQVWWGIALLLIGAFYAVRFRPQRLPHADRD